MTAFCFHMQAPTSQASSSQSAAGQPSTASASHPAASDFSEIQPASSTEDVSGQTTFASPYKNTAISKLMSETKGPSTTVPDTETSMSTQPTQMSPPPRATAAAPEHTVSHTAPTTERIQAVPGFDTRSSAKEQALNTGGFRSSSGVPSEDELAQLYASEGQAGQVWHHSLMPHALRSRLALSTACLVKLWGIFHGNT